MTFVTYITTVLPCCCKCLRTWLTFAIFAFIATIISGDAYLHWHFIALSPTLFISHLVSSQASLAYMLMNCGTMSSSGGCSVALGRISVVEIRQESPEAGQDRVMESEGPLGWTRRMCGRWQRSLLHMWSLQHRCDDNLSTHSHCS